MGRSLRAAAEHVAAARARLPTPAPPGGGRGQSHGGQSHNALV